MTAEEALAIGMDWIFEACKPEAEEVDNDEGDDFSRQAD